METLPFQFLAFSLYTFFLGFSFCDGFRLSIPKKLVCFVPLLLISLYVFKMTGQLVLELILPAPTLLALLLCMNECRKKTHKTPSLK